MTDAPETIWARPDPYEPDWTGDKTLRSKTHVEYRRADLPPTTAQIMADPRVTDIISQLEAWIEVAIYCSITDGVCCCGDNMEGHADPMTCGHTPTDHGAYYAHRLVKSTEAALAQLKEPKQ